MDITLTEEQEAIAMPVCGELLVIPGLVVEISRGNAVASRSR
mgnify:FL=1